jgi:crotonobetaine/carnitine-CoA ligase
MSFLPDRTRCVLRHAIEHHASAFPDRMCITFESGESWRYRDALLEGYAAANALRAMGVKRGDTVLVFLPNGPDWIRAWWGITFLGAVLVGVNVAYKGETLRHVCEDSLARIIITNEALAGSVERLALEDLTVVDPATLIGESCEAPKLETPIEPWDTHAVLYTSGTTGKSKGVIVPWLQTHMNGYIHRYKTSHEDTGLVVLPLFHTAALDQCFGMWSVGAHVVLVSFSVTTFWDTVRKHNVTMTNLVGTMGEFLFSVPPKRDDTENPLLILCGGPVPRDPVAVSKRFGILEIRTGFGMTEMPPPILSMGKPPIPKSCGKVLPGRDVRLVDENDIPVPTGKIGELIVRTDRPWEMNAGYWHRPEETARAWRNGWFHTGDLFYCDEDGNYFFVDRKKDALRRRGENISSFEVERELLAHPDIAEAACIGVPNDSVGSFGEDDVKVFIVLREGVVFDPVEITKFLIPRMPYYMVPRFVEVAGELPKTASSRVMKHILKERGNSGATWDREAAGIFLGRKSNRG